MIFIKKIRDEKKFENIDELIAQLQKDKKLVVEMNK
ncbi:MAG TPA: riboflavin kinase [Paludibacter sp.]